MKQAIVPIVAYLGGWLLGTIGLVQTYQAMERARVRFPQRDDYYLHADGGGWFALMFVGAFLFLIAPFMTRLKLAWKIAGSFAGVLVFVLLLKITAMVGVAAGLIHQ